MNYRLVFCGIFFVAFMFSFNGNIMSQNSSKNSQATTFRSPFRYAIVSNIIDPKLSKQDEDRRFIEILLEKKSFSKSNLIMLFKMVSERFPKPKTLDIDVYTDLSDVQTPEERDEGFTSESQDEVPLSGDFASFTRYDGKMEFVIHISDEEVEEVEIK